MKTDTNEKKGNGSKQSLYIKEGALAEMKEQAARLDRSLSWVVQRAWSVAKDQIKNMPSVDGIDEG